MESKSKILLSFVFVIIAIFVLGHALNSTGRITGFAIAGDSEGNSIPLSFDSQVSGDFLTSSGTYYAFSGEVGKSYVVEVETQSADTLTRVYNCGDAVLMYPSCTNRATFTTSWVAQNNQCLVRVYGYATSTYKLKVSRTETPIISGSFSGTNNACERSHYKFYADASKKYRIVYSGPAATLLGPNLDLILTPAQEILFQSKTSINDVLTPSTSGYYYLKITDGGSFTVSISEDTGVVKKRLGETCAASTECESNYCDSLMGCYTEKSLSFTNPGSLSFGSIINGALNGNEIAYYSFNPTVNQNYVFNYTVTSSSGVANFYILDSNKNIVVSAVGGGSHTYSQSFRPTSANVYYLVVRSGLDYSVNYNVLASVQQATAQNSPTLQVVVNQTQQAVCGDGICNSSETQLTCPVDCSASSQAALPDLIIENMSFSRQDPAPGVILTIFAGVKNTGRATASDAVIILSYEKDGERSVQLTPVYSSTFTSGKSNMYSAWLKVERGSYNFKAVVDPGEKIAESNESNNVAQKSITVVEPTQKLPDLQITRIYFSKPKPVPGDNLTIYAVVNNAGLAGANNATIHFTYEKDGSTSSIAPDQPVSIRPGEQKAVSVSLKVVNGSYTFNVFVDSFRTVLESNEDNNLAQEKISVKEAEISERPTVAVCGDKVCSQGENCVSCPTDCLVQGEVCCDGTRTVGNCCSSATCSSGAKCINRVCTLNCNNDNKCDASETPQICGDCISSSILHLSDPFEVFRSDLSAFADIQRDIGTREDTWNSQANLWSNESTNALTVAETTGVLGKIYDGLKNVKTIIDLPEVLQKMGKSLLNLKSIKTAKEVVSHLGDLKNVVKGVGAAAGLVEKTGVPISGEQQALADNSDKLLAIAITARDKTAPEVDDVVEITSITDLLFSSQLASVQGDYWLQESVIAATLSTYSDNLANLMEKQHGDVMSRRDLRLYFTNLYAYSRSMELYYANKYLRGKALLSTVSGKATTLVSCFFGVSAFVGDNGGIFECYSSFESATIQKDKQDMEKWQLASEQVKIFASKYNLELK